MFGSICIFFITAASYYVVEVKKKYDDITICFVCKMLLNSLIISYKATLVQCMLVQQP